MKPVILAAVQIVGPYAQTVPQAWDEVFQWLERDKPTPMPKEGFGLTYHDPRKFRADQLRYAAGVVMPAGSSLPVDGKMIPIQFAGGSFLRTRVVGPYTNTGKIISELRDQWIPKNGLVLDQSQPVLTIYRSDTRVIAPVEQVADVCLPVFADRRSKPRD